MSAAENFQPRLVLVTTGSVEQSRKIADLLLEQCLAACVNILPGVESRYWWQGKLASAAECVLLIKTSADKFDALAAAVRAAHSYECPEIVAMDPAQIDPRYRDWWEQSLGGA